MPYHIQPIREFLVRPAVPQALSRMPELAYNVLWGWEPIIRALFRRLDPTLWRECGYNPVLMLGRIPQAALEKASGDPRYLALYRMACQRFDAHMQREQPNPEEKLIAYFSAEYGLTECMPIYSGGLGVLSGDHLKASSDSNFPLVAVGLLYQQGYFRQLLNPDGWQQERYPTNDFYVLPVMPVLDPQTGAELKIPVKLPTGDVAVRVWKLEVGRVKLFLLDTNIPDNALSQDRDITDSLYGGDNDTRIRQEIVLGMGGVRALKAMGYKPTVYHINEGHSGFLALERIRILMEEQKLGFQEALEAARSNNIFTTHTSVPAGIDLFDPGLMYHYFHEYCDQVKIGFDQLMNLGRNQDSRDERFSMAILALNTSAYRNAVSRLHRTVSQEMWHGLWPQLPVWEVPITSITNGTHLPSWLNGDLAALYDQYLQPDWRERFAEPEIWDQVRDIPDEELLEAHRRRKRRLVSFVRMRQQMAAARRRASAGEIRRASEVLDPNAFTIGFARRFATYKRATLLFRDVERLKRILCNKDMPVQIVIAGKAHPKDTPGKSYIREIVQLSRDPDLWKHVVFVEDYDMKLARELVQGVDLWLNTPRRGEEACGTSGMKAGINGILNLSILDGWFDEAYEFSGGWAIGDREPYSEDQDGLHASNIYYLLENEIVPMFYEGREQVSREWMRRVKQSLMHVSPHFDCRRMVGEYMRELYDPAHSSWFRISRSGFEVVRDRARWNARVREVWDHVRFIETGPAPAGSVTSGRAVPVRAALDLAGLTPDDVRVEVVVGRIGTDGGLEDTEIMVLPAVEQNGSTAVFAKEIVPERTGKLGYALRVSPNHCEDPLTRPCTNLLKWSPA